MLKFQLESDTKISTTKTLTLGTLGPSGSSSDYVADYVTNQFKTQNLRILAKLFENFFQVKEALFNKQIDWALVPHAYNQINEFYMESDFDLSFIFIYPTPVYGLAKKKDKNVTLKGATIISHPAPLPLLSKLLPEPLTINDVKVELCSSTSFAAIQVKQELADFAITNENAALANNLEFIAIYGNIKMSWSIFSRKQKENEL
ncbi:LysR family transcriptional regulator [Crocosphaera sp. XPORK-15E]|uniref:LysR family transcriptional regulator n=1 Tax=Crocosphaera sp. XPORK-15E TaxID=3110247 RepID=UPI002B1EFD95|nr:LysR family transcriptional regulator [Crocosphaera sp. XPORK-15E]MEA5536961.1 LysR family transcriptional regulator [Crocosphaera sp. XPORK-15E]